VRLRIEFADALGSWGDNQAAVKQYGEALRFNDLLNWDEKKRLSGEERREVERKVEKQGAGS
jgi:hypothetical protein